MEYLDWALIPFTFIIRKRFGIQKISCALHLQSPKYSTCIARSFHVNHRSIGYLIGTRRFLLVICERRRLPRNTDISSLEVLLNPGNVQFFSHILKENHKAKNQREFATSIVESLRSADPSTRFLTMNDACKYVDIGDAKAFFFKVLEAPRNYKEKKEQ